MSSRVVLKNSLRIVVALAWTLVGCGGESSAPPVVGEPTEEGGESEPEESGGGESDGEVLPEPGTEGEGGEEAPAEESCTIELEDCTATVCPGDDDFNTLQEALSNAQVEDIICLGNGTFNVVGRLAIGAPGFTVRGAGQGTTVLDFGGQVAGTKALLVKSHGVRLEDFSIVNYLQDGIVFENANEWTVSGVEVSREWSNEGAVGDALRAVGGKRGRVEWSSRYFTKGIGENGETIDVGVGNLFAGSGGAGIHLRGVDKAIVRGNSVIRNNSLGVLLAATTGSEMTSALVECNGAGVLITSLPGSGLGSSDSILLGNCNVAKNGNNGITLPEEGEYSWAPEGSGVVAVAARNTHIRENSIHENGGYGVLLLSHREAYGFPAAEDANVSSYTLGTFVANNLLEGNGLNPEGIVQDFPAPPPVPSLATDGCVDESKPLAEEERNCFSNNTSAGQGEDQGGPATFVFFDACNGFTQISFDPEDALADCTHPDLPAVDVELIEVCDNGLDDDDDGATDCEDGDCYEEAICAEAEGGEGPAVEEGGDEEPAAEEGGDEEPAVVEGGDEEPAAEEGGEEG